MLAFSRPIDEPVTFVLESENHKVAYPLQTSVSISSSQIKISEDGLNKPKFYLVFYVFYLQIFYFILFEKFALFF